MGSTPSVLTLEIHLSGFSKLQPSVTMAPACARLVSLEMTPPGLSSPPLLAAPATREGWLVWDRRTPMSVTRHSPRGVSSPSSTPLSTESSPTGTIWRRSGTTPSTMSSVWPLRSSPSSRLRLPSTPRPTGRRWPRSCSRPSTAPPCMSPSRLCSPCTPLAVPPVSSWTLVTVSPTVSPYMKVMPSPTPLFVSTWLSVATLSLPPLRGRSSVTSRRSSAMLLLTSSRRCPPLLPPPPLRSPMSFPTARSSPLVMRGSGALRLSSSLPSLEWRSVESTRPPSTPSGSAMLTSGRTCTPTLSWPVAPPCTPALPIVCKRRSPLLHHPPLRSRSLLPQRGNTPSGSEVPSCLPFPPSNRCGSPNKSTTSAAHPLSTGNASNFSTNLLMQLFEIQLLNRLIFHCHLILIDSLYVHMQFNEIMKM